MRMLLLALCALVLSVPLSGQIKSGAAASAAQFEFRDGDRVALLGDTFIEREQAEGYIESRLSSRLQDKKVIFRNLGWSADTVLGESRAGFDAPEKGFDRLKEQIAAIKPTVAILGYGMASSFQGAKGLPRFKADMNTLMNTIEQISAPEKVRFIVLGPIRHEHLGAPLPDPSAHNKDLKLYSDALQEICRDRQAAFIPFFDILSSLAASPQERAITENGIHPTPYGYWRLAFIVEQSLGLSPGFWRTGIGANGAVRDGSTGIDLSDASASRESVAFTGKDQFMVISPSPLSPPGTNTGPSSLIQFVSIRPGKYVLKVDGEPVAVHAEREWNQGQYFWRGGAYSQVEELRRTIVKKNELFFHRWRPQNQTYLFGFRRHEQGQNAREIPMFDPLITELEDKIESLKALKSRRYELVAGTAEDEKKLQPPPPAVPQDPSIPPKPLPHPSFQMGENLEVTLFAENPHLAKPIQINFDPQGRLWVASSAVYPQIEPGQQANDKILILEDSNNDGRADKTTVFADGLLIPTGVEPGDGGAYVANSTELLFFKDTDGNGYADSKRILLSGFGTEDTHHILHTLRWGHDGQLYMNQSIYIHSHVETPHGVVRLDSGGIWNYRPTSHLLGVHMKGLINSWGHHFDKWGQSFATDGAGHEGINWVIPQAMYVTYEGARRTLHGVSPGNYPKFCGLETVESDHFPPDWNGTFVTCDFRANRVVRFSISDQDSGYVTKQLPDIMLSTNVSFRPIDAKIGPDGALYIADWSNPIIQHGEVDFRDPRRDHEHGRIWRVTYKGRPLSKKVDFNHASNTELLDTLISSNGYARQRARRVLTERGAKIQQDLEKWTAQQQTEQGLLEALWIYQSLDKPNQPLLEKVIAAKDGQVRAAAARVIAFWHARLANPLDLLAKLAADDYGRVRVEAVRAAAKIPQLRSAEIVLGALDTKEDRFLDYAIWLSINDLAEIWVKAVQDGGWSIEGRERQLEYALKAIEPGLTASVLAKLLQNKPIPADGGGPWIELLSKSGSPAELRLLLDNALSGYFNPAATRRALDALVEAVRLRNARPSGDLVPVSKLFEAQNPEVQAAAIRLAGSWKLGQFTSVLLKHAGAENSSPPIRDAAYQSLRDLGGDEVRTGLRALTQKTQALPIRAEAVKALASVDLNTAIPLAIAVLTDTPSEEEALSLWRSLLSNKGAAPLFAQQLPRGGLPEPMAKAGLRAAREGGRNEPNLVLALARSLEGEGQEKQLAPEELKQLVAFIQQKGDPARGEQVYRRQELGCVTCHSIGGVGGKVGPDMTSLGASVQLDYIIESLLFPNRKIKEGYHAIVLETSDELEYSGILVRETDDQLILRDATNKEVSVPKNRITKRAITGSLMPAGLIDTLPEQEQADLFRFLSELGKPGPYDASKGNVARLWRLLPRTLDLNQLDEEKIVTIPLSQQEWSASAALVDGRLPKAALEVPIKQFHYRDPNAVYAATQIEAAKSGPLKLNVEGVDKAPVWIDGKFAGEAPIVEANVSSGPHTIVVKIKAAALPEFVRLKTEDATFLTN